MSGTGPGAPEPVATETVAVPVAAGGRITGTLFTPSERDPDAVVVVHSATAVPARFYTRFASFLAANGCAALTYDYRGTARSGHPRAHRRLRMRNWIGEDVPAAGAWARDRFPDLPQLAVGHSIGGQALVLGGAPRADALAVVASHAGVLREIPDRAERLRVRMLLHVVGPVTGALFGYVPSRRFGLGEDLPLGVVREWSRWSRRSGYFFDDPTMEAAERAATVTPPVLVVGLDDDPWAAPSQIGLLTGALVNAPVEVRRYAPADVGVEAIGHLGFFRDRLRSSLWPELLEWAREHTGTATGEAGAVSPPSGNG